MHTVTALLCFVVVIHWLIFPYPSGLLHWHCGNLTIAPVPAKQPWWIWINTSCEYNMNDCITTTKQSTTKPCAYFLGYTVCSLCQNVHILIWWHMRHMLATSRHISFNPTSLIGPGAFNNPCYTPPYCFRVVAIKSIKMRYSMWRNIYLRSRIWCIALCRRVNYEKVCAICDSLYHALLISQLVSCN